jgi:eukaryotic-like serine/threonine-protein kinase
MSTEDPYIGRKIEDYKIETLLGKGGMGSVYKGEDTVLRRPVALKVLAAGLSEDTDAIKRFEREARILAEVAHPNIAQVYRIGKVDGVPYYVMEFIDGKSLQQILAEEKRLTGSRSVKIILDAARGLKAAAERNIIHRDIKPANIMISADGNVKIVDFGIAKAFSDDTFKTATGLLLGTPRYMSPEQGRGATVDLRADIYSLGATFYHMVTGVPPFDSDNPITLIQKHITDPVRSISEYNPNVPEKICNLIYAMLAKSPGDRVQDYSQLIISLENATGHATTLFTYIPQAEQKPVDAEDQRKARRIWLIAAAIAAVLLIGFLIGKGGRTEIKKVPVFIGPSESRKAIHEGVNAIREYQELQKEMREQKEKEKAEE